MNLSALTHVVHEVIVRVKHVSCDVALPCQSLGTLWIKGIYEVLQPFIYIRIR